MADEMTREEALQILDTIPTIGEQVDALEMAIKALEQQPITTTNNDEPITVIYPTIVCDDAVSREAVIEILENYGCTNREGLIFKDIRALPPVTQKSGKWIEHPEIETSASEYLMFYECSECGNKPCFCKSDIHKKRFCSNCGAKMQERR